MKKIKLTQNKFAIVDDADFEWLSQWKWSATKRSNGIWYAMRNVWNHGNQYRIYMHRLIMDLRRGDRQVVDHINHDGLENCRCNLRVCTQSQNIYNGRKHFDGSSRFKGVSWYKPSGKWTSSICVNGKVKRLGYFDYEVAAMQAYNKAARQFFGEFAYGSTD